MGWADCGTDSKGRPIGYAFAATCDYEGCETEIDRGMGYACGGQHGEGEHFCELYFCASHLFMSAEGQLCPSCYERYMAWVCQELRCTEGATGTVTMIWPKGQEERERVCERHGRLWAMGEGCRYIPDQPIRVVKEGERWEIVDGWMELRLAREMGATEGGKVKATDRATGTLVWLIFTEGEAFQVEPVGVGE